MVTRNWIIFWDSLSLTNAKCIKNLLRYEEKKISAYPPKSNKDPPRFRSKYWKRILVPANILFEWVNCWFYSMNFILTVVSSIVYRLIDSLPEPIVSYMKIVREITCLLCLKIGEQWENFKVNLLKMIEKHQNSRNLYR